MIGIFIDNNGISYDESEAIEMPFNVAMTCGYDTLTNELCGWGVEITDDKYTKDVYITLDKLIQEYYFIKMGQKLYKSNTKKEKLETQKKLLNDKKKLTAIANNISYGYADLFLKYYNWSKPLCRHYMEQCKKDVKFGPNLVKVKKINKTIYEDF